MNDVTFAALFDELTKLADVDAVTDPASAPIEAQTPPPYREHPALTVAKGVGGFALGAGAGYVAAHGTDRAIRALGGDGVPTPVLRYGAPLAGAAAGMGFGLLQHRMMQRMKNNPPQEAAVHGLEQDSGG